VVDMSKMFEASMAAYKDAEEEGISAKVKAERQAEGKRLKAEALRIQQQISLAIDQSVGIKEIEAVDPSVVQTIKETFGTKTSGETLNKLKEVLTNPFSTEGVKFQIAFQDKFKTPFENYINRYSTNSENIIDIDDETRVSSQQLLNKFEKLATRSDVSAKFKEMKTSTLVHYGTLPGINSEESRMATKAAEGYFKGMVIPSDMEVAVVSGEDAGDKKTGTDYAGYTVAKYGFAPEYAENGGWELQLVDGDGNTQTVMLDAKQVTSPQLKNYMESNMMRFATTVDKYNTRNKGDEMSFDLYNNFDPNQNLRVTVRSNGDADPLIKIENPTGEKGKGYAIDSNGNLVEAEEAKFERIDDPVIQAILVGKQKSTGIPFFNP
jgi:hypothetical protein